MHNPGHINGGEYGSSSNSQMQGVDSHYMQEADHGIPHHHNDGGSVIDDDQEDVGGSEGMEEDEVSDHGDLPEPQGPVVPREPGDELTLSFQGEVFVFDSVSAEKVQVVLLILEGREVPGCTPSTAVSSHQNNRTASLMRFREKRKERNFDKKIRYNVRKEVALRRQRDKGQFISSKKNSKDTQKRGSDKNPPKPEIVCVHCGTSEKSTPMMRRGPTGPRSLCNACGLKWANKGSLKELPLPKNSPLYIQKALTNLNEESESPEANIQNDNQGTITENSNDL